MLSDISDIFFLFCNWVSISRFSRHYVKPQSKFCCTFVNISLILTNDWQLLQICKHLLTYSPCQWWVHQSLVSPYCLTYSCYEQRKSLLNNNVMQLIYLQNRLGVFVLFFMLVRLIPSIEGLTFLNVFLAFLAQCYKVGKLKVTFTCDKTIKICQKEIISSNVVLACSYVWCLIIPLSIDSET